MNNLKHMSINQRTHLAAILIIVPLIFGFAERIIPGGWGFYLNQFICFPVGVLSFVAYIGLLWWVAPYYQKGLARFVHIYFLSSIFLSLLLGHVAYSDLNIGNIELILFYILALTTIIAIRLLLWHMFKSKYRFLIVLTTIFAIANLISSGIGNYIIENGTSTDNNLVTAISSHIQLIFWGIIVVAPKRIFRDVEPLSGSSNV